ncbi:kinase-like domain-containing protein [Stachybotrys elegans]|uniref:Kinase-like domain-containing protein n=1 Tax=Stachybotrys elegans TaxID=80388 RepID=A0A8K0SPQ7_9HYPO|nr:kinase-like domain-containing protein [Stachybotrys elegans]
MSTSASTQICFTNRDNYFIPREVFAQVMTYQRVLDLVFVLKCFGDLEDISKRQWADRICFGDSASGPSLKIFAALIGVGHANEIRQQVEDKLNDDCLPLQYNFSGANNPNRLIHCQKHADEQHPCQHKVNEWEDKDDRVRFMDWTRQLTALYITSQDGTHLHYEMMQGDRLPINRCKEIPSESIQVPPQYRPLGYGGYSDVFQVKIHDTHSGLPKERPHILNRDGTYALKRLTSHKTEDFELELSSLLFAAHQQGKKKHVIQLLVTFEVKQPGSEEATFYLLFDWAKGNLRDFWKQNPDLVGDPKHGLWMATQFHGLAEALELVHNDRMRTLHRLPPDISTNLNLYGRHGDITPKNLLVFESKKDELVLVLADFGLGKLHTQYSRSQQDPKQLARTETYRPPEFDFEGGKISPASDIFSLGCVFLEHISFHLKGPDALDQFSKERVERDIYRFEADTFFRIEMRNGEEVPVLKPKVREWIQSLKDDARCTKYIFQMLEVIESDMLDPNPTTRLRADRIVKILKALLQSCKVSETFYLMPMSEDNRREEAHEGWAGRAKNKMERVTALVFCTHCWNTWSRIEED